MAISKLRRTAAVTSLTLVAGLATLTSAQATSSVDATVALVEQTAAQVNPQGAALPLVPGTSGSLVADGTSVATAVPQTATGQVVVTSDDGSAPLRMGLPNSPTTGTAALSTDETGASFDSASTARTDVVVQGYDEGAMVATVIRAATDPTAFSYQVQPPSGGSVKLEGTSAVVLDAAGEPVGFVDTPWARDANGAAVPTTFQVSGNTLIQTVDHRRTGVVYPVVADPYLFKDLVKYANWRLNNISGSRYGWTLEVKPTLWARANAGSFLVGQYGWNELYRKYRNRGLNTNLGAMRDQWICHQVAVAVRSPRKPTWNLDEWRKDISLRRTIRPYSCNPPAL